MIGPQSEAFGCGLKVDPLYLLDKGYNVAAHVTPVAVKDALLRIDSERCCLF
jgi:hypothetical protein